MGVINSTFIHRLQEVLKRNPKSPLFATLSQAYLQMGDKKKALEILEQGLSLNPYSETGRIVLSRILIKRQMFSKALKHLGEILSTSPYNLVALELSAYCFLKTNENLKSLNEFKKRLILSPDNEISENMVSKLEILLEGENKSKQKILILQKILRKIEREENVRNG